MLRKDTEVYETCNSLIFGNTVEIHRVYLDIAYYCKLRTEKYCSKIIFKYVNNALRPVLKLFFWKKILTSLVNSTQDLHKKRKH